MNERISIRMHAETKQKINELALMQSTPQRIKSTTDIAREALEEGLKILKERAEQKAA